MSASECQVSLQHLQIFPFLHPLLLAAAELIVDGSVEVRTFTKTLYRTVGKHQQFYSHHQQAIGPDDMFDRAKFRKLETIVKDVMKGCLLKITIKRR